MRRRELIALVFVAACARGRDVELSVIGTSDLHGHVEATPLLGGYLRNLRAHRQVVLVDGGDLFQGTLESNRSEGAPVVRAMNALGYNASAIGNHEFDFGPAGPKAVARTPDEDPRGAFKARAHEAAFPFLGANIFDEWTGKQPAWDNVVARRIIDVGGVKVGITGGTTVLTPTTAISLNVKGLRFEPLGPAMRAQAEALRREGAEVVVVAVHAGGRCKQFDNPEDVSSCAPDDEAFRMAAQLPPHLVDVIVGGHTHNGVAHRVAGTPMIQAYWKGESFGRVDLTVDGRTHKVKAVRIFPPHHVKPGETYEGAAVVPDPAVAATFAADAQAVAAERARPLGPTVAEKVWRSYDAESPLGNFVADLIREAEPAAEVGLENGGGLRADLAAGPLTYGGLFEVLPFDNRLALVTMRGATLRSLLRDNYGSRAGGFLSISGLHVRGRCASGGLELDIKTADGKPLDDARPYKVAVPDFLALGGEAFGRVVLPAAGTQVDVEWDRPVLHDAVIDLLGKHPSVRPASLYDRAHPRVELPSARPACAK